MGQHQLIIIVFSTIVAAIGITMGITLFEEDSKKFQKDAASHTMLDIAGQAIAWCNRPQSMGGGMDAYGSASFSDLTLKKLGYEHEEVAEGALTLPDGSCITGKPVSGGKTFQFEWKPVGGCSEAEKVVLKLEVSGPTLDHISVTEGDYASTWRNS